MQIKTDSIQKEIKSHGNYQFPVLVSYESLDKYDSGSFMWHWHPEIEITLITSGRMLYKADNESFNMKKDDIIFCNSGVIHSGEMQNQNNCKYIAITFDPKIIYGYENSAIYEEYVKPILQNVLLTSIYLDNSKTWHKSIKLYIEKLIEAEKSQNKLSVSICLQEIWNTIYENQNSISPAIVKADKDFERLRSIISYIEFNYENKITLNDISVHINLCREECCKLFKRYMKITIFDYIIKFRIEKASKILKESDISITEVANEVGFSDANHFSALFHRLKGTSPREFRKSQNYNSTEID